MKLSHLLITACLLTSCSSTKTLPVQASTQKPPSAVQAKRDGLSFETAIVIEETSGSKGIPAEYAWLRENCPGFRPNGQSLIKKDNKPYDVVNIMTKEGEGKKIYFDISNFYGKL